MQKITPFLWFNANALEAAEFYTSIFKNSKILYTLPGPNGNVTGVSFILEGQEFKALNGGPHYTFTPAISLFVDCTTQEEVDYFWEKLGEGGQFDQCGWLKDKFGLSWQIIPSELGKLLGSPDPVKANKAMQAMSSMKKIDIAELVRATEK